MKERFEKLKHWFVNVLWYHYKWAVIGMAVVVAFTVYAALESEDSVHYDFFVVFAQDGEVTQEQVSGILEILSEALSGDGAESSVSFISVNVGDLGTGDEEAILNAQSKMMLYFSDNSLTLFFLDEAASDLFCSLEYFAVELETYGIMPDTDNPYRVYLGDNPLFAEAGLANYYGHINDLSPVGRGDVSYTDTGVTGLSAILDARGGM